MPYLGGHRSIGQRPFPTILKMTLSTIDRQGLVQLTVKTCWEMKDLKTITLTISPLRLFHGSPVRQSAIFRFIHAYAVNPQPLLTTSRFKDPGSCHAEQDLKDSSMLLGQLPHNLEDYEKQRV
ncbi:predicted protein [Histoplasma capsulatum G186AR]|uniref:Uncharacterized protein n=1 Tax=Ajellomyces capsulatus (strain G186AR / H82 / ATCC MYA-2454 / RMSCC 2432) TaxID=447093 RepID=C0ND49_AJECG|nr:uncharacterized protein HCBG_01045 [Histoplasma capsulatum G186AR]EEH11590.1 predicted protein [Histoplasma capsulatum G186AR]